MISVQILDEPMRTQGNDNNRIFMSLYEILRFFDLLTLFKIKIEVIGNEVRFPPSHNSSNTFLFPMEILQIYKMHANPYPNTLCPK